ncbi:hypothetical protein A1D15_0970 [Lactiplantibacillus plantarum]|nr:hypothetical protein A1D15_0970 [Lactiplantibacillus plantarum]
MKRWNRLLQRIQVKYGSLSEQQLLKINYWLLAIYLVLCGVATFGDVIPTVLCSKLCRN